MSERSLAPLATWLAHPLSKEVEHAVNRLRAADDVRQVVLLPDVHLASDVTNGTVVATGDLLYPQAVGGDIGCGMATVPLDVGADWLAREQNAARLLSGLYRAVPSNKHRHPRPLPASLESLSLSDARLRRLAKRDGRVQLGTLGRGNHFLEFQADSGDRVWALVHSGSRAMGQAITRHHLETAEAVSRGGLGAIDSRDERGEAYLADVVWARGYARENRLAMLHAVAELLEREFTIDVDWSRLFNNDHNHVEREEHGGESLWVHRKGAQRSLAGEEGIVPGSMGAASFHTTGRGHPDSLSSCSHGAGRQLSRTEARQQIGARALAQQVGNLWYDHRRTDTFRDEAPGAYKDVRAVMRAQRDLVRVERELRPVLGYR